VTQVGKHRRELTQPDRGPEPQEPPDRSGQSQKRALRLLTLAGLMWLGVFISLAILIALWILVPEESTEWHQVRSYLGATLYALFTSAMLTSLISVAWLGSVLVRRYVTGPLDERQKEQRAARRQNPPAIESIR